MKPFHLKRHQDIIAFEEPALNNLPSRYIGFHASNLEIAEISKEAFDEMISITTLSNEIPLLEKISDAEAFNQLQNWNDETSTETRSGQINFGIRSLTINVTQVCNLHCTYCAAGGDGTYGDPVSRISIEKTLPQLKFLMDLMLPGRKFHITFVGGEPLLYPEGIKAIYDYVYEYSKSKNINPIFGIVTNATVITEKILEIFKKIKIHITVSLDGDAATNDVMRPQKNGSGSTELTLEGIKKLNTIKDSLESFGISAVFNEANQNILKAYYFFNTLDPDWIDFTFAYSQNSHELQSKYIEQMNLIADVAWSAGKEIEIRKIKTFDHYFNLLDSQQKVENHCGAGKSYLMMDAKNQLYTCPWTVGDADEVVGTGADLNYDRLEKYQKPLIVLNNCQTCWARYLCGGGCMYIHKAHTGDKHTKDILFCERTRSLILTALLYYKKARVMTTTPTES